MHECVGIINYGLGNLASVVNAFEYIDIPVQILSSADQLRKVSHAILPGVGAFGKGMANIKDNGWDKAIFDHAIEQKKPLLGICLGMQLLATTSEELGVYEGLNLLPGQVKKIVQQDDICIPHVGWNSVEQRNNAKTYENMAMPDDFYFVHSYVFCPEDEQHISGMTMHGQNFVSSVESNNIWGVQFHPEKSQGAGLAILKNFWNYKPC